MTLRKIIRAIIIESVQKKDLEKINTIDEFINTVNYMEKSPQRGFSYKPNSAVKLKKDTLLFHSSTMENIKSIVENGFMGKGAYYSSFTKTRKSKEHVVDGIFGFAFDLTNKKVDSRYQKDFLYGSWGVVFKAEDSCKVYNSSDKQYQVLFDVTKKINIVCIVNVKIDMNNMKEYLWDIYDSNFNLIQGETKLSYFLKNKKLTENIQLADKVYFKTNKLEKEDKDVILSITNGDSYTKIIADFYFYLKPYKYNIDSLTKSIKILYNDVVNYNKNVFPIYGYDVYSSSNVDTIVFALEKRRKIIETLKKLPSIAIRNLKEDIRTERSAGGLDKYLKDLEYFVANVSQLSNRSEEIQEKFFKKMFKSNTTLSDLMRFVDDKQSFLGGFEFTKDIVREMSETEDFDVIYEQGDVMIVRVDSPDGIKAIGCNSLWCFTYGSGFDNAYRQWNQYSYNDIVYVLIDFSEESDSETFMHVLIGPLLDENGKFIKYTDDNEDDYPMVDMSNEKFQSPYYILEDLFGADYKKIIKKYLNFED